MRSSGSGATPSAGRCRSLRRGTAPTPGGLVEPEAEPQGDDVRAGPDTASRGSRPGVQEARRRHPWLPHDPAGIVRRLAAGGRQGLDALLTVLLAPSCAACGTLLHAPTRGPVCPACWRNLPRLTPPVCDRCGDPLPAGPTDPPRPEHCPRCRHPHALIRHRRAVGPYEGTLRRLVHVLKYEQRHTLAPPLGRLMRQSGAEILAGVDCVVAVPLHPRRQRARGFNQAAELAAQLGRPVVDALRRTRATTPQMELPAGQRRRNVRGAFAPARRAGVQPGRAAVEDACVMLVDDVTTTGATLDACARVLRRAGAREVRALTLARVVRRARP